MNVIINYLPYNFKVEQLCNIVYYRAVARGGNAPTMNPSPHANFRNLANLEEALEKMQWCFHSKAFTSDHLSHVLINIFIVFLLGTDRILCVCVCVCVRARTVY